MNNTVAKGSTKQKMSSGAVLGLTNIVFLLMAILQISFIDKGGEGVPWVIFTVSIIAIVCILGLIISIRDLKKELRLAMLGVVLHTINVLVFLAILVLFVLNIFY